MSKGRIPLGREQHLGGYRRVFEIEDGLEVDENNFVEIERTRVYFDDVLGITYHRQAGIVYLILLGLMALFFAGIAVLSSITEGGRELVVAIVFACLAAPFVIAFVLRLILKVDVITVYGRRTMARMKFYFRKGRAREIYRDLALKIRARQEKAAAAQAPSPAPPELPLPPSAPPSPA